MKIEVAAAEGRGIRLDPRSKLALTLAISVVLIGGGGSSLPAVRLTLTALPLVLTAGTGRIGTAVRFCALYLMVYGLEFLVLPHARGIAGFFLVAASGICTRMLPGIVMGWYFLSTTTVSEFVAAMERMRLPRAVIIPFAVMFRFLPTIREEGKSINDAMRMRRVSLLSLEYRLVPLLMSTVKIGEELSASALTRGLGNPVKRTNICAIGFRAQDLLVLLPAAACVALFTLNP